MPAKYRLHPGTVISQSDGQRHNIGAGQIASLYGVQMRDCIIAGTHQEIGHKGALVDLYPSHTGDYSLPAD